MWEIIPGILEKDWNSIEGKIGLIKSFAKTIQIDVIDGKFAPNATFLDPKPFKKYSGDIFFEVQLMVENPLDYIENFANAGFKRFIGQIEEMPDQKTFIDFAKKFGEAGLAIDAQTSLDNIKVDFNYPDCFTLMSVKAGFSGQLFISSVLEKTKALREKTLKPIEIDGGINRSTIRGVKEFGANRCVVNSALFKANNLKNEFENLRDLSF